MMKYDTYVCNTCKKAKDVLATSSSISALPRCVITQNCAGILSMVPKQAVADAQYHINASADAFIAHPLIHDHVQSASRRLWTINHNLGASAIIQVMVHDTAGVLVPLYNGITVLSNTNATTVLQLDSNHTGTALCTARQTGITIIPTKVEEQATVALTVNSTMVLAVRDKTTSSIELVMQPNPLRPSDVVHMALTDSPSNTTPWSGSSYVVISNQRFFIKYINISDVLLFHRAAANFFVKKFNGADVERGSNFVLLSSNPHIHASDRNLAQAVDLADLTQANQNHTLLTQTALLCTTSALSVIYPPMKVA